MIDASHVLIVVDDHLGHLYLVWGQPRSGFHGVLASRVCCHNIHVALVEPPTEHDVMICGQLLALPSLESDVGDLLRQATTVLTNRTAEVGFGIVQVANQREGRVEVIRVQVLVAVQVASGQLHDDVVPGMSAPCPLLCDLRAQCTHQRRSSNQCMHRIMPTT